jgi:hypothetical protein
MKRRHLVISFLITLEVSGVAVLPGCGGSSAAMLNGPSTLPLSVTIRPYPITAQIGTVQQFSAIVSAPLGTSPSGISQSVVWSVAGPGCSGASCGTIDAAGKYTAPANAPDPASVMVTATSAVDSKWFGTVTIVIVDVAGGSVSFSSSPSGIAFGDQMVNTTSTRKAVTLTNTGSTPQPFSARINGVPGNWQNFAQTNDCPSTIAAGASCTFYVTFTPSATGNRAAVLFFDGFFDEEASVNLTGTGTN